MNFRIKIDLRVWISISIICLYLKISLGLGQSQSYTHYSIPEGLPSSEVYDIHQDSKGFIWFATDNGVVKYDGNQMEIFQANEGLTDPVVFGIVEDSKGRIWFRTFSGRICFYDDKKINAYQFNDTLSQLCKNGLLFSLYPDSQNNIWFATHFAVGKIDVSGKIEKESNEDHQLYLKMVDDQLLIGHLGAIELITKVKANGRRFQIHIKDTIHKHPINCAVSWKNEEYFSIGATVFKIGKESVESVFIGKDQIISLSKDIDDNLWVGYLHSGTEGHQNFKDSRPLHFPFLESKSVTRVLHDKQKGYWVSTLEDGVYYIPEFALLTQPVFNQTKIRAVYSRHEQTIIGDESGLVSLLDRTGKITKQRKFNGRTALSVFLDSDKNIWVSTNIETYILDSQFKMQKVIPVSLSSLTEDPHGFVWGVAGTWTLKFNKKGDIIFKFIYSPSRYIYLTENNTYLFGRLGINVFTHTFDEINIPKSFERLKVSRVMQLSNAYLLITTLGSGFYVVNNNDWSYRHYNSKRNFIADNIYTALIVDSTLWLGTEKGIATTKIYNLLLNSPSFQFFTKRNGLSNNRIVNLSYSKPNVWAFYDDGFSLLPAHLGDKKQDAPIFYLKDVLINSKVDSLKHLNELSYDQNNIQVNFGFIDLRNQNILIRYRLSSLSSWNYARERSINFFSLSPGNYFLELEYSIDNLHWFSALKYSINISPQWLMNWRIQLTILVVLSFFGYLYYRRRIRLLREKQKLLGIINEQQQKLIRAELETLESERSRIAKDLHDSVGTNLAAIKLFLNSFFKKSNEPNAAIIEATLQETIQGTRDIITNLSPAHLELFGLVEAVKIYSQRIKDQFDINFDLNALGQEIKQSEISIHLFRIIQELITNSLKYASANIITININYTSDLVIIRYEDDGVGFKANSISKGNGLLNIQSRIQILEGKIKFESNGKGVSYHIEVPLKIHQS